MTVFTMSNIKGALEYKKVSDDVKNEILTQLDNYKRLDCKIIVRVVFDVITDKLEALSVSMVGNEAFLNKLIAKGKI